MWQTFGGVGARSRRGWGSIQILRLDNKEAIEDALEWTAWRDWFTPCVDEGQIRVRLGSLHPGMQIQTPRLAFSGAGLDPRDPVTATRSHESPYSSLSACCLVAGPRAYPSWPEALAELGLTFLRIRSNANRGNRPAGELRVQDHDAVHALLAQHATPHQAPFRAAFGLPHNYFFSRLPRGRNMAFFTGNRAREGRRASPLLVRAVRLSGPRGPVYLPVALWFKAPLTADGMTAETASRHNGIAVPDWSAVVCFLSACYAGAGATTPTSGPRTSPQPPPVRVMPQLVANPRQLTRGETREGELRFNVFWVAVFPDANTQGRINNVADVPEKTANGTRAEFVIETPPARPEGQAFVRFVRILPEEPALPSEAPELGVEAFREKIERFRRIYRGQELYGEGPPALQAARYRSAELTPVIIDRVRSQSNLPPYPVDLLISISGRSSVTTILAWELLTPGQLLVISAQEGQDSFPQIAHHVAQRGGLLRQRVCPHTDPLHVSEIIHDELKQFQYSTTKRPFVVVDLTGGTKMMSVAAALAAWQLGLALCHITGRDDPELRQSLPGTERLLLLENPTQILGDQDVGDAFQFLQSDAVMANELRQRMTRLLDTRITTPEPVPSAHRKPNPFIINGLPLQPEDHFAGQSVTGEQVIRAVTSGASVWVVGPRRSGKTSLLLWAARVLQGDGHSVDLVAAFDTNFMTAFGAKNTENWLFDRIAALHLKRPAERQSIHARAVLFVDEAEPLLQSISPTGHSQLRARLMKRDVVLVLATCFPPPDVLKWQDTTVSPLWNVFQIVTLHPLAGDELDKLYAQVFEDPDERERLVDVAMRALGGSPYLCQMLGWHVYEALAGAPGSIELAIQRALVRIKETLGATGLRALSREYRSWLLGNRFSIRDLPAGFAAEERILVGLGFFQRDGEVLRPLVPIAVEVLAEGLPKGALSASEPVPVDLWSAFLQQTHAALGSDFLFDLFEVEGSRRDQFQTPDAFQRFLKEQIHIEGPETILQEWLGHRERKVLAQHLGLETDEKGKNLTERIMRALRDIGGP